jgi:hypothetical protein
MALSLTPTLTAGGEWSQLGGVGTALFEDAEIVNFAIDVDTEGTNTNVEVLFSFPAGVPLSWPGGGSPPILVEGGSDLLGGLVSGLASSAAIETALEADNSGWTVTATLDDTTNPSVPVWEILFTRASLSAGSHVLDLTDAQIYAGCGATGLGVGPHDLVLSGSSDEVPTADTETWTFSVGDIETFAAFDDYPPTAVDGTPFTFYVGSTNHYSTGTNSVTVTIDDGVTCSEPTTTANPDGWTIGSWTSPGGGIQWQCTLTRAGAFSGISYATFETTPSGTGTLEFAATASNEHFTDDASDEEGTVTVETGITWSVDATSGIGVPANATEWGDMITAESLAASAPSHLWLKQEASGDITDVISSLTLAASGAGSYENAVSGWSRLALGTADGTGGGIWQTFSGPSPTSTSMAVLAYLRVDVASTERQLLLLNGTGSHLVQLNITGAGLLRCYIGSGNAASSANYEGGAVFPVLLVYDRTNSRAIVYTNQEKIAATYAAVSSGSAKRFGGSSAATALYLYGCWWTGADAETLSTDANAKALLEALGWTVTGY